MPDIKPSDLLAKAGEVLRHDHFTGSTMGCCDALYAASIFYSAKRRAKIDAMSYLQKQRPLWHRIFKPLMSAYWFGHPDSNPNTRLRLACLKRAEEAARRDGK